MFLKEYALRRYGPLPDSGKQELGHFNLFFGANEEGKTLTIDALIKMLFGRSAQRSFQEIKRVEEQPEGYLVLQLEESQELKLPEAGSLPDLLGISPAEFANIFIIRDSNLAIANEGQFYRGVTNRLTGMRSGEINLVINELRELGKITNTGDYKNTVPDKLKDRLNKAKVLLEKGGLLAEKMIAEGYTAFEEELATLKREKDECREMLNLQREAAGREKYEVGLSALSWLSGALAELESLKRVTEADFDNWRSSETGLSHVGEERTRLEEEFKESRTLLEIARKEALSARSAYREADQDQKRVVGAIENNLVEHDRQQASFSRWVTLAEKSAVGRMLGAGFTVFLLTLAGYIFRPSWWLSVPLVLAAVVMIAAVSLYIIFINKKSRLKESEANLLSRAEVLNLGTADIHALRIKIGMLEKSVAVEAGRLSEAEKALEWRLKEVERQKKELEARDEQFARIRSDIAGFQKRTGAEKISEVAGIIKRQQELQNEIEKEAGILESHFGKDDQPGLALEKEAYWSRQINSLSDYKEAAPGVVHDRNIVKQLNEKMGSVEQDISALQESLDELRDEMRAIEKELPEVFGMDESEELRCETTADLRMMLQKLEEWIRLCEENRAAALAALSLFEALEQEEEEKVSTLFGSESPVSRNFSQITVGLYEKVAYDSDHNIVNIVSRDGYRLTADQLSGGAYDQLYFAIRLALGEKLLQGEKGFFILDDPFIKADPGRLQILLSMLAGIVADGWQILYFSSKGEIWEALKDKIAAGEVLQIPINPDGSHV